MSTAAGRRARFGLLTLVMLAAVTASAVIANLIGEHTSIRFDATDTGEHRLSPKTGRLLGGLSHDYEVVLAVNHNEVSSLARQRVADVADLLDHASPRLTITSIDTASASGLDQFDRLIDRLAQRDQAALAEQKALIESSLDAMEEQASSYTASLAPALRRLADAAAPAEQGARVKEVVSGQAAQFENASGLIRQAADRLRAMLAEPGAGRIPPTDQAAPMLASALRSIAGDLDFLQGKIVTPIADAESMAGDARIQARALVSEVVRQRDRFARLADSASRLKPLDLQRIAKALQATSAVLVIGPPGVGLTAIDTASLYPPAEQIDLGAGVQADLRRRAEDLLASAIGMLEDPAKPIVIFVHGEGMRLLQDRLLWEPKGLGAIVQRLSLQGIDTLEWPVVAEDRPPSVAPIDPNGVRPVVFAVLSTDASQTFASDPNLAGPARASKLGQAVEALVERGEPVLLCLNPSTLPSYGQPDPMVAPMRPFGLQADTARPILNETVQPGGRTVQTDHTVRAEPADHPIYRAIQGLPTRFPWPLAVREAEPPEGTRVTRATLYSIPAQDSWAESQWLGYWQVAAPQRPSVTDPPAPDSARDDTRGPWPIAVAAERTDPDLPDPARLVAVGSNTWFLNAIAGAQSQVYGRLAPAFPGNAEFFEAAVHWLAGKDDLIAQTTTARAIPLIGTLTERQLSLWRWAVVAGLPLLVLSCGLLWRILRG